MIEKEFAPYEEAFALKELGFNEPCFGYWKSKNWLIQEKTRTDGYTHADQEYSAPTFSQAFRWFREKYELYSFVFNFEEGFGYVTYKEGVTQTNESFDTYEEAELACLNKLIEIVKTV
jgi:hypothetical protein